MGGGFNRREPLDTRRIHLHPEVVDIFRRHQWLRLFEIVKGYDYDLAFEFSMDMNSQTKDRGITFVGGLAISLNPEIIIRVTTLPLGIKWSREDKATSVASKNNLFTSNENHIKDKDGVRRESLPYPWDEVVYHIVKYMSCEGRMSVVYAYHFILLHEIRFNE